MCGIVGLFDGNGDGIDLLQMTAAMDTMERRGPDDDGIVSFGFGDDENTLSVLSGLGASNGGVPRSAFGYLGHKRLAIIDLSRAGRQPMQSADGQHHVTYNGEIYNYIELRKELVELGCEFTTATDTEVILAAYRYWGPDCFSRFNGMWAIAIVDLDKGELVLARDRFGIKPLYVTQGERRLGFASEIRTLVSPGFAKAAARRDVVREFVLYGNMPAGEDTFFDGVRQVRPGSYERYDLRSLSEIERQGWWHIDPASVPAAEESGRWKETFLDAVRIRMRSDVPVGSCLSGGLDSSAIVCGVGATHDLTYDFNTFTSCYDDARYDERHFAKEVVDHVGAKPHWVQPGKETSLMDDLDDLIKVQGEPFPTLSIYSQYCVMRKAHQAGIKVLLDGQGADELLIGYDYALAVKVGLDLKGGRLPAAAKMIRSLQKERQGLSYPRLLSMIAYNNVPMVNKAKNRVQVGGYLSDSMRSAHPTESQKHPAPKSLFEARRNWMERHPLPHLLRYEDRNSMAFSIETRLPFLDYRLVNLAFGLSEPSLNTDGWTKYIIRDSMQSMMPEGVTWRKSKMGFPAPTDSFLAENREMFSKLFSNGARSAPMLNVGKISKDFESEALKKWHWRLASVELWMRAFDVDA